MRPDPDTTDWRGLQITAILGGLTTVLLGRLSHDPPLGWAGALLAVAGVVGVVWSCRG